MSKYYFKVLNDTDIAVVAGGARGAIDSLDDDAPPVLTVDESIKSGSLPKKKITLEPIVLYNLTIDSTGE